MKKKVCRSCRSFYDEPICPDCKSTDTTTTWKGRLIILNSQKSEIAQKAGYTKEGEYAIKLG